MTTRILGKFFSRAFKGLSLLTSIVLIVSCGGGGGGGTTVGGGGIGGTGSVASVGVVTAIASVEVNGVKFSCVGATVTTDDGNTAPSGIDDSCVISKGKGQLREGMVVVVKGNTVAGKFIAQTVTAQSNVTGPAVNIDVTGQTFTVLNQFIDVDDSTRFEINGAPAINGSNVLSALKQLGSPVVRVSGLPNAQGRILATLVETKNILNGEFEVRGKVTLSGATTFSIGNLNVHLSQAAPTVGTCVEAKGIFDDVNNLNSATFKNDDDCGGSVSGNFEQGKVEGIVSGVTTTPPTTGIKFKVGNQDVVIDGTTRISGGAAVNILNGVKVEAEGQIASDVLTATKLTIKSNGNSVRIEGLVDGPATGDTFNILGIAVKVTAATEFDSDISLDMIVAGNSLRIEGGKSGATQVTATKISNSSGGGGGSRTELRGPLDADPVIPTITILGVNINTTDAKFQNSAGSGSDSTNFFQNTKMDNIVKVRGNESPPNQIQATEIENED